MESKDDDLKLASDESRTLSDNERIKLLIKLKELKEPIRFTPCPISNHLLVLDLLDRIPFLKKLMREIDRNKLIRGLVLATGSFISQSVQLGLNNIRIGLLIKVASYFFQIPFIFLGAYLAGEKPPISLTRIAKFLYSCVILGVAIFAVAAPFTFPFVLAGVSLAIMGYSTVSLGRLISQHKLHKKSINELNQKIEIAENELGYLQERAASCDSSRDSKGNKIKSTDAVLSKLVEELEDKRLQIQDLYDKRGVHQYKLDKRGLLRIANGAVEVMAMTGVAIGAGIAIFFPPLGAALTLGFTMFGVGYLAIVYTVLYAPKAYAWLKEQFKKPLEDIEMDDFSELNRNKSAEQTYSTIIEQLDTPPKTNEDHSPVSGNKPSYEAPYHQRDIRLKSDTSESSKPTPSKPA